MAYVYLELPPLTHVRALAYQTIPPILDRASDEVPTEGQLWPRGKS